MISRPLKFKIKITLTPFSWINLTAQYGLFEIEKTFLYHLKFRVGNYVTYLQIYAGYANEINRQNNGKTHILLIYTT